METSCLANIIFITKVLESLTRNSDLVEFKQCLMNELNISEYNESLLFCKILLLIHKQLSPNAIGNLKAKITQIKEKNNLLTAKETKSEKLASNLKQSHFNKLSSDCIDYFATFLSKKESIKFGYLNRNLYIETQKRSYLLKRQSHRLLVVKEKYFNRKAASHKFSNFAFSAPTELALVAQAYDSDKFNAHGWGIVQSERFRSLFRHVNQFECDHSKFLPFIPIDLLFNKNKNNEKQDSDTIKWFDIMLQGSNRSSIQKRVNKFVDKYQEYFKQECESNNQIIRNIEQLAITTRHEDFNDSLFELYRANKKRERLTRKIELGTILKGLSGNYRKLWIHCGGILTINSLKEFYQIFHSNLIFLCLSNQNIIKFTDLKQMKKDFAALSNNKNDCNCSDNNNNNINVQELRIEIAPKECGEKFRYTNENKRFIHCIRNLDYFKLRKNIQTSIIMIRHSRYSVGTRSSPNHGRFFQQRLCQKFLHKLVLSKYMPNLKNMNFEIVNDTTDLITTCQCFNYLIDNRKRILNSKKIGRLECIKFEWLFDDAWWLSNDSDWSFSDRTTLNRSNRDITSADSSDDTSDGSGDDSTENSYSGDDSSQESIDSSAEDSDGEQSGGTENFFAEMERKLNFVVDSADVVLKGCNLTENEVSKLLKQIVAWFRAIEKAQKEFPRSVTLKL